MSNQSNLYRSLVSLQNKLNDDLQNVNEYLTKGTATTVVTFYNSRKKIIGSREITGNWTTALGKHRVKLNHEHFIKYSTTYATTYAGNDVKHVKVESPFVDNDQEVKSISYTAFRDIHVTKATI